jgi:hypothetical protein
VLNVFRMFSRMDGQRLRVQSDGAVMLDELLKTGVREKPDVSLLGLLTRRAIRLVIQGPHLPKGEIRITPRVMGFSLAKHPRSRSVILTGLPIASPDAEIYAR